MQIVSDSSDDDDDNPPKKKAKGDSNSDSESVQAQLSNDALAGYDDGSGGNGADNAELAKPPITASQRQLTNDERLEIYGLLQQLHANVGQVAGSSEEQAGKMYALIHDLTLKINHIGGDLQVNAQQIDTTGAFFKLRRLSESVGSVSRPGSSPAAASSEEKVTLDIEITETAKAEREC